MSCGSLFAWHRRAAPPRALYLALRGATSSLGNAHRHSQYRYDALSLCHICTQHFMRRDTYLAYRHRGAARRGFLKITQTIGRDEWRVADKRHYVSWRGDET